MSARLLSLVLSADFKLALDHRWHHARRQRRMGVLTAFVYLLLVGMANATLRLDGPAWQQARQHYGPWFRHLSDREYRFADPIRYVVQALWIVVSKPLVGGLQEPIHRLVSFLGNKRRALLETLSRWAGKPLKPVVARVTRRDEHGVAHRLSAPRQSLLTYTRNLFRLFGAALAAACAILLITQPFSMQAQFVFVLLLWSLAMMVRHIPGRFSSLFLIVLSLAVSGRYIWWRYTATLNWNDSKDIFFGLILLSAETYSWLVLVLGYIQTAWPLGRNVAPLPRDNRLWPTVDLMIPTYNEDLSVVRPTVYAALGMDWPADKLRIHLLDDGRRPEFRDFARQAGVNYIIRPDGRHAKAGNLNHAMGKTDGELIAIFDCDHVPARSFLQLTAGWFLKNSKLALVQTPHHFFSPDPFERNLQHFGQKPNENSLFYGLIQEGNDYWNAAFFCGSCAVLRRNALDAIGGFAVETVTEDAHTALRLHRQGYDSAYLRIPMAAGLATESLSAHIGQRIRWARGMVQIFRTDNPLLGRGLNLFQRLCYCNGMLHFLAGIPRLIYLTAPLAFLVFHAYIIYAPAIIILLYVLPHMVHAALTNSVIQGSHRHTFWGEIYETVLSWYIALPTTVALLAPKKGLFNVTEKGGLIDKQQFDWRIAIPYVVLALLNIAGLVAGVWRYATGPKNEQLTVMVTMLWVLYNLIILGGALAVATERRQIRRSHRVQFLLPVDLVTQDGKGHAATMTDYSDRGLSVRLVDPSVFAPAQEVSVLLSRGNRQFSFPARIIRIDEGIAGLALEGLTTQQHIDFVQCTFARSDAWLTASSGFLPDRPIVSFLDVLKLSMSGYRHMATYLPFPLDRLFSLIARVFLWAGSFFPRTRPVPSNEKQMA